MSISDYEKEMEEQYRILDQIDIEKYIKKCKSGRVWDIITAIENDYDNTEFTDTEFMQGCIFNHCNEEEFIDYLKKRFGERFKSHEYSYRTFTLK